jgi:DNA-binding MarR family transcriptional regulator
MGDIAERMQIQHHSAVELVNRSEQNGFVRREPSDTDRRKVMLQLTPKGERILRQLASYHREALSTLAPILVTSLQQISRAVKRSRRSQSHPRRGASSNPVE